MLKHGLTINYYLTINYNTTKFLTFIFYSNTQPQNVTRKQQVLMVNKPTILNSKIYIRKLIPY